MALTARSRSAPSLRYAADGLVEALPPHLAGLYRKLTRPVLLVGDAGEHLDGLAQALDTQLGPWVWSSPNLAVRFEGLLIDLRLMADQGNAR